MSGYVDLFPSYGAGAGGSGMGDDGGGLEAGCLRHVLDVGEYRVF